MALGQMTVKAKNIPWRRVSPIAGKVVLVLAVAVLLLLSLFLFKSNLDGEPPQLFGCRLLTVTSGSMKPALGAGSAVAVRDVDPVSLAAGDIATFQDPSRANWSVTHRIVKAGRENMQYITRGVAKNTDAPQPVPAVRVIGKAAFALPLAGVFNFIQTRKGLLLLIILPSLAIIIYEFLHLWREVIEQLRDK